MAIDSFDRDDIGVVRTARGGITPSDTLTMKPCRALMVTGAGGDIKVGFPDGTYDTFPSVGTGWSNRIEGQFVQVYLTGTTATGIRGFA